MATSSRRSAAPEVSSNLFAAGDMGTNSFKLLIVRADLSSGRFFTLDHLKEPVLLGLDTSSVISPSSLERSLAALRKFQQILHFYDIPCSNCRFVATSAVREASNQSEFVEAFHQTIDLHIDVLSGLDEARLIHQGVLQFYPVLSHTVLTVDIGGGSTEFVVGLNGEVLHSISLKLGHVILTETLLETGKMRLHIRNVLESSGLVKKIKEYKIDKVIGSSGIIKAIEEAVSGGYMLNLGRIDGVMNRDWKFSKEELKDLVEWLEIERKEKREALFQKKAKFIVAGAILLEEIFKGLGIEEMEVSGYALGEGVISEMLGQVSKASYNLHTSARWMSVIRMTTRFNNKKRIKTAAICAGIAKVGLCNIVYIYQIFRCCELII